MARAQVVANVTAVDAAATRTQYSVEGATVQIYQRGTTTTPSIYAAESGGSPLTPPFTTDASGRVIDESSDELWVSPQSLDIIATKDGSTYQIAAEAFSAGPGGISKTMADATLTGDYEHAFSTYKTILSVHGKLIAGAGQLPHHLEEGNQNYGPLGEAAFYWDAARYTAGPRTTKLAIDATALVNTTAPTSTFKAGLYPVTGRTAFAGVIILTIGTVVPSSQVTFTAPAASSSNHGTSEFDPPSTGYYVLAVDVSVANIVANSAVGFHLLLQTRQV